MFEMIINKAATILRAGGLVAFPTETVYGLGADARNETALAKIYAAKGRPADNPLIVHLGQLSQLNDWAQDISDEAWLLAKSFWPGPLTLVLSKKPQVSKIVTGGQETIGLRIPSHPMAQALLAEFGSGIAAPSANQFTRISTTNAQAVYEELGDKVDLILDGGDCAVGVESTIIDMSQGEPVILRPGMISKEAIERALGRSISFSTVSKTRAPGQHQLHYAPKTKTYLVNPQTFVSMESAILLAHSDDIFFENKIVMPKEAQQYARKLYATLRQVDNANCQTILIEEVPDTSEWDAIRDRLKRACSK